jgi:hypothetical protein
MYVEAEVWPTRACNISQDFFLIGRWSFLTGLILHAFISNSIKFCLFLTVLVFGFDASLLNVKNNIVNLTLTGEYFPFTGNVRVSAA